MGGHHRNKQPPVVPKAREEKKQDSVSVQVLEQLNKLPNMRKIMARGLWEIY